MYRAFSGQLGQDWIDLEIHRERSLGRKYQVTEARTVVPQQGQSTPKGNEVQWHGS